MEIAIAAVLGQNITLVYDALDLQAVDSRKLKGLMGGQAMVMDTPDVIVAMFPPIPLIVQIGDRRIRITLQQESKEVGGVPLWEIAAKCQGLVPPESRLVAYGFNYDEVVAIRDGDAQEIIKGLFVPDAEMVESALEGHLLTFSPRLQVQRGTAIYDLILEPLDEERVKAHANVHFDERDIVLPSPAELEASYRHEFEYVTSALIRLLQGGK